MAQWPIGNSPFVAAVPRPFAVWARALCPRYLSVVGERVLLLRIDVWRRAAGGVIANASHCHTKMCRASYH